MSEDMKIGPNPCPSCHEEYGHLDTCKTRKMVPEAVDVLAVLDEVRTLHAEIARLKAELAEARKERDEARNTIESMRERLSEALNELRCPDCGCADQVDAECNECGCDAPVCGRTTGRTLAEDFISANADADLLGRESNAWRAEYKKWNDGNHHFREPFEFIADTDARPTAAARVKGGAS